MGCKNIGSQRFRNVFQFLYRNVLLVILGRNQRSEAFIWIGLPETVLFKLQNLLFSEYLLFK